MPWGDWQFWVVTMFAGWGLWIVVRPFLPKRSRDGCPNCASGAAAQRPKRVRLRIEIDRSTAAAPTEESPTHPTRG
jgi:hypothetical protein